MQDRATLLHRREHSSSCDVERDTLENPLLPLLKLDEVVKRRDTLKECIRQLLSTVYVKYDDERTSRTVL